MALTPAPLKNTDGKIIGYSIGCSRGSTGPLCKFCKRGTGTKRCDYPVRQGKTCDVWLCDRCAAHKDPDEDYCPDHRERAGLGPSASVAAYRAQLEAKERRATLPPRWIEHARYAGKCRECLRLISSGERILYFSDRGCLCADCGKQFEVNG